VRKAKDEWVCAFLCGAGPKPSQSGEVENQQRLEDAEHHRAIAVLTAFVRPANSCSDDNISAQGAVRASPCAGIAKFLHSEPVFANARQLLAREIRVLRTATDAPNSTLQKFINTKKLDYPNHCGNQAKRLNKPPED
jgi:hypothetical protein